VSDRTGDLAGAARSATVAFRLFVAAAIVDVVIALLGIPSIGPGVAKVQAAASGDVVAIYIAAIVVVLGFELLQAVLFVVFGRTARRGARGARIWLAVLTALALIGFSQGYLVLGLARFACAAVGTALLFVRPANALFARP